MGRPSRAKRSQRDRRWMEQRFTPMMNQMFSCMRRTMCEHHFDEFHSLRFNLYQFCNIVAASEPSVEEMIAEYFPVYPNKMTQERWKKMKAWLKTEEGAQFQPICMPWYVYARETLRPCAACQSDKIF